MSPFLDQKELKRQCKDPRFCIVCLQTRDNVRVDEHHVCLDCRNGSISNPGKLPAVTLEDGKTYFFDKMLRQLRHVHDPHDSIDF